MRAVSRRTAGAATPSETIAVGALRIDRRSHTVDYDGRAVNLTPKEYDLLVYLAADAGAVKTRAELMHDVWDENWWGSTKTLDVHVASLRKKLDPALIETVRAVGYRLATPSGPHP
jgi:two-component system response regulator RegX3